MVVTVTRRSAIQPSDWHVGLPGLLQPPVNVSPNAAHHGKKLFGLIRFKAERWLVRNSVSQLARSGWFHHRRPLCHTGDGECCPPALSREAPCQPHNRLPISRRFHGLVARIANRQCRSLAFYRRVQCSAWAHLSAVNVPMLKKCSSRSIP